MDGGVPGRPLGDPERRPLVRPRPGPGAAAAPPSISSGDGAAVQRSARCRRPRSRDARDRGSGGDRADPLSRARRARSDPIGWGLDAVARLVDSGVCVGIKYAVVRPDPVDDPYLKALLERVDRRFVISGMGERPAVAHLEGLDLPGFTTGSGCLAPALSQALFAACGRERLDGGGKTCAGRSFPSKTSATPGVPRACCTRPWSWPVVATTGGIPPLRDRDLGQAARGAGADRKHSARTRAASAQARRRRLRAPGVDGGTQDAPKTCGAPAGSPARTCAPSPTARAPSRPDSAPRRSGRAVP